ncbi:hypothetical protein EVAR_43496_1 [Eumeta japonica]|uniref:Uncharacterized protein n=1 Tax=Eumeta variegata TaxID=151549 RepID=A0A4C1YKJ1_EUMVA|nr:hypothetical protein EVAR_43496_1 [Eumeta japonica]
MPPSAGGRAVGRSGAPRTGRARRTLSSPRDAGGLVISSRGEKFTTALIYDAQITQLDRYRCSAALMCSLIGAPARCTPTQ